MRESDTVRAPSWILSSGSQSGLAGSTRHFRSVRFLCRLPNCLWFRRCLQWTTEHHRSPVHCHLNIKTTDAKKGSTDAYKKGAPLLSISFEHGAVPIDVYFAAFHVSQRMTLTVSTLIHFIVTVIGAVIQASKIQL